MSTTYIAVIVNLAVVVFPLLGISVESQALEVTLQTLTALVTGIWILIQRYKAGGITKLGKRI